LLTLAWVASVRRIAADNLIDTANPPASSTDELIRDPLESRLRLRCKLALMLFKLYAAALAAVFELILIILYSFTFIYAASALLFGPLFPSVRPHFLKVFSTEFTQLTEL
jgi:hypothetical protein